MNICDNKYDIITIRPGNPRISDLKIWKGGSSPN